MTPLLYIAGGLAIIGVGAGGYVLWQKYKPLSPPEQLLKDAKDALNAAGGLVKGAAGAAEGVAKDVGGAIEDYSPAGLAYKGVKAAGNQISSWASDVEGWF